MIVSVQDAVSAPPSLSRTGLFGLLLGAFAVNFTFGAGNIVLPDVSARLHTAPGTASLFVALYGLALASVLIFGGRLGDRYGRRRVFLIGLLAFAGSSLLVSAAPQVIVLLALRVGQGAAAGLLLPQVLATIQVTTSGAPRMRALSLYAAASAGGTTVGQVLAGTIVSADLFGLGWRPVFWLLAMIAAASTLALRGIPETTAESGGGDGVGTVVLGLAMTALLVPLALGRDSGWPWWVGALLGLAVVGFVVFWWWENRIPVRDALVPPLVLRHRPLLVAVGMTLLFFAGYGGFSYVVALTLQNGLGFSARNAGIALVPFALAFLTGALVLPPWIARFGTRRLMIIGGVGQMLGLATLGLVIGGTWPGISLWLMEVLLVWIGSFQAVMFTPLLGAFVASVPQRYAGLSGGLFSTFQQLALAIGVSIWGLAFGLTASVSPGAAFAVCLGMQAVAAGCFVLLSRRITR